LFAALQRIASLRSIAKAAVPLDGPSAARYAYCARVGRLLVEIC
jgi:hypothetical protein